MELLVLGGTRFSGLHLVRQAVASGHSVTVLHRGSHADGLPGSVRRIVGDRDPRLGDGLERVQRLVEAGQRWDAVVDMCGFVPRVVDAACGVLRAAAGRYLFVSSVSVYPVSADGAPDESSAVIELEDPSAEAVTGDTYGGLKVLCERVVETAFAGRCTVVRPGLIVGPGDPTDRFTYWPRRLSPGVWGGRGGRVLVPAELDCPTRWIDGRDLASFMLKCVAEEIGGVFNCLGPPEPVGFGAFLEGVARGVRGGIGPVGRRDLPIEWVRRDAAWLEARGVTAWKDIPVFTGPEGASMGRASATRAYGAGMITRPLEDTARDTLSWDRRRGLPELACGVSFERERSILAEQMAVENSK